MADQSNDEIRFLPTELAIKNRRSIFLASESNFSPNVKVDQISV
jgi:hypothetical protein